jgi:predicted transcriptional regulator
MIGAHIDQILRVDIGVLIGPTPWKCWSVAPRQSIQDAADTMCKQGVTLVFVQDKNGHVGLLTRSQVLDALRTGKAADLARNHMVGLGGFIQVKASDKVETALDLFATSRVKRLVVTDNKGVHVALLTLGQLLRWLGQKLKELRSAGSP